MVATPPGDYGSAHILITAHGSMPGGDVWSCGLRTIAASLTSEAVIVYARHCLKMWVAFFSPDVVGIGGINPVDVTLAGVTVRQLSVSGVTVVQAEAAPSAAVHGAGAAPQSAPNQTALALTLRTSVAGRHGKGRIYIPALQMPMLHTGRATLSMCAAVGVEAGKLLERLGGALLDLNDGGSPPAIWRTAVQSRTSGQPGAPITGVEVGDVLDTIRRRRGSLREVYSHVDVAEPSV